MEEHDTDLLIEDCKYGIDRAFKVMNWFASGEHLKQWSRVDHESILGEVYLALAPVSIALSAYVTKHNTGYDHFEERVKEIKDACDREKRELRAEANKRIRQAERTASEKIDAAHNLYLDQLSKIETKITERIDNAVAKALARHEGVRRLDAKRRVKI